MRCCDEDSWWAQDHNPPAPTIRGWDEIGRLVISFVATSRAYCRARLTHSVVCVTKKNDSLVATTSHRCTFLTKLPTNAVLCVSTALRSGQSDETDIHATCAGAAAATTTARSLVISTRKQNFCSNLRWAPTRAHTLHGVMCCFRWFCGSPGTQVGK